MKSSRSVFVLALLLGCALPISIVLADQAWYVYYDLGEKALDAHKYEEALQQFTKAIELKGDPGVRVRIYGTRHIAYFPYFKLGQSYLGLGKHDAALQAFKTEEQLGAITGSPENLQSLKESRARAEELKRRQATADAQSRLHDLLASAHSLEAQGKLDLALDDVGKALALDPKNAEALGMQERLRIDYAAREEAKARQARAGGLVAEGREHLAAGRYDAAAAAFGEANDLHPDPDVAALQAEARRKLKEQLDASGPPSGAVAGLLAEATRLEHSGLLDDALVRIENALVLDPTQKQSLLMRDRLLKTKQALAENTDRSSRVADMVENARKSIQIDRLDDALSVLVKALALDPQSASARAAIADVYKRITFAALAPHEGTAGGRIKIPPALRVSEDFADMSADGVPEKRVHDPRYLFAGTIVSQSPVTVQFVDGRGGVVREAVLKQGRVGDLFVNVVTQEFRLPVGVSTLAVVARDEAGQKQTYTYRVHYVRPWFRSPWFLVGLGLALAGSVATGQWRRAERRRLARTRRFNPYVAGAPVLDDNLFVGREDLIARILQTIHGNSIMLHGERRIGKTTLLHHLKRRLLNLEDPVYKFFPVYVDLQGTPEDRFFATIGHDVVDELAGCLGDGAPPAGRFTSGAPYGYYELVADVRRVLDVLHASTSKRVKLVLLIDEVDELNSYNPRVNQRLRSLFMKSFAEDMVAVVAGVAIRKQWESEGSPWYNFFEEIEVRPFDAAQAAELIERPIRDVFRIESGLTQRVITLTGCRPYLIQKLCTALVDRAHRLHRHRITLEDLEAIRDVVEAPDA